MPTHTLRLTKRQLDTITLALMKDRATTLEDIAYLESQDEPCAAFKHSLTLIDDAMMAVIAGKKLVDVSKHG